MPSKDPFAQAPDFLAAFEKIAKDGFFEELESTVSFQEGKPPGHCRVRAVGYVPNHRKYAAPGCAVFVDPSTLLEKMRRLAKQNRVRHVNFGVESEPWPLWNRGGNTAVGSRGTKTTLSLTVTFKR